MKTTQDKYPPFFRLSNGSSRYGAQMGRQNVFPKSTSPSGRMRLRKLRFVDAAYDEEGAYWGMGKPIWFAAHEDGTKVFVRASDRRIAKHEVRKYLPQATFHN